ncbi:hypothetical protein KJ877_05265 [bacterium]|nr:hypothetical protein [bacterium]MBU1990440.1 hypothetical protein [bacterium]
MNTRYILFFILGIDAFILFLQTSELSISYTEASLYYGDFSFLQSVIKTSVYLLGQNDFSLRLPMILFHIASAVLLYALSKRYLKDERNRIWLVAIFILLPGVISSAMLVNSAGLVIFGLLLFAYLYEKISSKYIYALLLVYSFADGGFSYLFLGLMAFSAYKKKKSFFIINFILFCLSIYIYGLDPKGMPEGHFLDTLGIYSAIFTPIIFVYIFYVLYRRYLTKEIDILWFISTTALLFSLVLSFRQRVEVEHFAPYLIISMPLIAQTFYASYRVRLSAFRTKYKAIFAVSLVFLFFNSSVVFLNKYLYIFLENPEKHFAYEMHIAKELATKLQDGGIHCLQQDSKMAKRLQFYNISKCNEYILNENKIYDDKSSIVTISYNEIPIYFASVTKVNNK